ncbi:hypothetical protein [Priestia aryabhattai]|uniref:hypothetical protein n=1 Tax=Priestia aryabhattai TaxID=412384 RepID=UPI0015F3A187|nr:hypothetical protein [Priestia aryabhattai]
MKKDRKKRYWQLREIRRERDYQSGHLQFANRPITKPSMTIRWIDGKLSKKFVTTKQFMKKKGLLV